MVPNEEGQVHGEIQAALMLCMHGKCAKRTRSENYEPIGRYGYNEEGGRTNRRYSLSR